MGSQPSSFSSNREFKGFLATKQQSARHKFKPSLSKNFSNSDILTFLDYDDFLEKVESTPIRPHSEKIISQVKITDLSKNRTSNVKNLKSAPETVAIFPKINSKLDSKAERIRQNLYSLHHNLNNKGGKLYRNPNRNCEHLPKINQTIKKTMENTESFENLEHWVHKNEPYIQAEDVHEHVPLNDVKSKAPGASAEDGDDEDAEDPSKPKKDFETQKTEYFEKLRKVMQDIKRCQNDRTPEGYITDEMRELILKMYNSYFSFKKKPLEKRKEVRWQIAEETVKPENGTVVIFCDIFSSILQTGYRNSEGKSVAALFKPLRNISGFLQNTSDSLHPEVIKIIVEHTSYMNICIQKLKDWAEPHLKKELQDNDSILCGGIIGMFHNLAQCTESIQRLRDIGIIEAVKPYLESSIDSRRLGSLAILANVVNEAESEIIKSNDDVITFLIKRLEKAMRDKMRRSGGWSVREITRTIRMVGKNDNNKRTVVTHGALPLLVEIAEKPNDVEEQREAVGALWTLSFDKQNQEEIINDKDCRVIDTLIKLHESAEDEKVKNTCGRALWTMRDKWQTSEHYKHIGRKFQLPESPHEKLSSDTHVMLSYNWGNQDIVKEIAKNLRSNGVKVWMDIDDMQGSTLQAMANAVEKSDIVLICYSQKYKMSDNCRAEAEYAFQLKKKIIPLRMEKGYKGDGWLGFIIGAKLFFDFSGKYPFENKITELIKEVQTTLAVLKGKLVAHPEVKVEISPVVQSQPHPAAAVVKTAKDIDKVKKWTPQHVGKWLDKNSLPRNLLGRLSGIEVAFLHVLVHESPDMFYKTIGEQLGVKDILTMAKLRFALEAFDINI